MLQRRRKILMLCIQAFDMLNLALCLFLIIAIIHLPRQHATLGHFLSMRLSIPNIVFISLLLILWHWIFNYLEIYSSKRLTRHQDEMLGLLKGVSFCTLAMLVMKELFNIAVIDHRTTGLFWVMASATLLMSRYIIRLALEKSRLQGKNLRNVVFVGVNDRSLKVAGKIRERVVLGYEILGFFDEIKNKDQLNGTGYRMLGKFDQFQDFIRSNVVDEVFVCLPVKSLYEKAEEVISRCEEQGIVIRFVSDMFNLQLARASTTQIGDYPIVTFYTGAMESKKAVPIKRCIDILLSLILILLSLPVMAVAAILVKISSQGRVLFVQERVGRNKRRFALYKFRTMFCDAEKRQKELEHLNEAGGAAFKVAHDPRITPIGRFLRKTSIDELPQLFNVLKGDMSLVGPRPLPVRDYDNFSQDWHRRRFSVRPGITCIWQISGRSSITFDRWMELDMEYIDNWSLWLDMKILYGTIPAVFKGTGAS